MNNKKESVKKGQVTIFVILAIAIVFVLILLFIRRGEIGVIFGPKIPIDDVKQCVLEGLDNSTEKMGLQGGTLEPKNYYLYDGNKVEYLCYAQENFQKCVMQKPLLKQSIEKELKNVLEKKSKSCLALEKASLEKSGYDVSFKEPEVTVELIPNNILVTINSDLRISKGKTESYKSIKIEKTSKLYELVMITSSILNWEARYGESEIMNYMMYYPNLKVEKKKQSEGTVIYILTDKNTKEKLIFAARSYVMPVGVTGN